jgi:hypothetical protein
MKIKKTSLGEKLEQNKNPSSESFISEVVDRIFLICMNDQNFKVREKLQSVENQLENQRKKVTRQEGLLSEADRIKTEVTEKISELDEDTLSLRETLLESLGSEL